MKNLLKNLFILYFLSTLCLGCTQNRSEDIVISSSTPFLALTEALVSDFQTKTGIFITVKGIMGEEKKILNKNLSDLIITDSKLAIKNQNNLESSFIGYTQTFVIGNTENKITKLTIKELKNIFNGDITNWNELNSSFINKEIQVLTRETGSGIRRSFEEDFLENGNTNSSLRALTVNSNSEMKSAVASITGSIGYVSETAKEKNLTKIKIIDSNQNEIESPKTMVYIIWEKDNQNIYLEKFLDYIKNSESAHQIIKNNGLNIF